MKTLTVNFQIPFLAYDIHMHYCRCRLNQILCILKHLITAFVLFAANSKVWDSGLFFQPEGERNVSNTVLCSISVATNHLSLESILHDILILPVIIFVRIYLVMQLYAKSCRITSWKCRVPNKPFEL